VTTPCYLLTPAAPLRRGCLCFTTQSLFVNIPFGFAISYARVDTLSIRDGLY